MRKRIFLIFTALCVVLSGILLYKLDIPNWKSLDIESIYAQPRASMVFDAHGESMGTLAASENRIWTPLEEIPGHVRNAFIAAEDQQFYRHRGINIRRIFAALLNNIRTQSYGQGASTITQQLIKLTHLTETKSISRKAQEAWLALQLERRMSKDEILECYLNTVYFGSGAYGVASASHVYFGKAPGELTLSEAALLAGVIKSPSNYAPDKNPEKAVDRRNFILGQMEDCGFASPEQAETAKKEPLSLAEQNGPEEATGWYMDAVLSEAAKLLSLSVDEVLTGGYKIHTGYEPGMQEAAEGLFDADENFPTSADDGTPVQAALVCMRPDSGEICAMMGGRRYEVQRGLNRAVQIRRSPGSAIKPISTYAAAIDAHDFTPTSFVEDTPRDFDGYSPGNASGNSYGKVTLREALSRSLNIATVDLADLIGINQVRNYSKRFGIEPSAEDANLALSLGSMSEGVSPAAVCAAYSALANGGLYVEGHTIRSIQDSDGRTAYLAQPAARRAVSSSSAYMITDMLKTAASVGSAHALSAASIPVAAKTGTVSDADGSTRDVWTSAYTPELSVTVWMGFDNPDGTHRLSSSEGGSGYPARLCAAFLNEIKDMLSGQDFQKPEGVEVVLIDELALQDCEVLLAAENTPSDFIVPELFHSGKTPNETSGYWNAPGCPDDLRLLSRPGQTPVIQFTSSSSLADYLVLRTVDGKTEIAAELRGDAGDILRFADAEADPEIPLCYSILPRHRLLYERGEWLTGKESAAVTHSPGGLLGILDRSGKTSVSPATDSVLSGRQLPLD